MSYVEREIKNYMTHSEIDDYPSVSSEYEELARYPFMYAVFVPQMTKKELIDFYLYLVRKRKEENSTEYNSSIEDLETYDVIQKLFHNQVTEEMLLDPTPVGNPSSESKSLSDEESSSIEETLRILENKRKKVFFKTFRKMFRC